MTGTIAVKPVLASMAYSTLLNLAVTGLTRQCYWYCNRHCTVTGLLAGANFIGASVLVIELARTMDDVCVCCCICRLDVLKTRWDLINLQETLL